MKVVFTTFAEEDKAYWQKSDPKKLDRIDKLLDAIKREPYSGIGKPEPLRFNRTGYWSRRIDREHRLVYKVTKDTIYVAQCRYHYESKSK